MNINNKDVIQSYIMTTAKYDFSADEKRILLRLVETWQYLLEGKELKGKIEEKEDMQKPLIMLIELQQYSEVSRTVVL